MSVQAILAGVGVVVASGAVVALRRVWAAVREWVEEDCPFNVDCDCASAGWRSPWPWLGKAVKGHRRAREMSEAHMAEAHPDYDPDEDLHPMRIRRLIR